MSLKTPLQRMADAAAEVRAIADKPVLTAEDEARADELSAEFNAAEADLDREAKTAPRLVKRHQYSHPWTINVDNSFAARSTSAKEWRERALSAMELVPDTDDNVRQAATRALEEFDDGAASLSKAALASTDPAYVRAFTEMLRTGGQNPILDQEEVQAIRRMREVRAMSLTDTAGGYLVPFQLESSIIITSDGSMNAVRKLARKVIATGDKWHGVSAGATDWSWDDEAEEVSDDASTFAQPVIDIHKAQGFIPMSHEALSDGSNVLQEVGRLLAFGKDSLEAAALINGSGTGEPWGIISALKGAAPPVIAATTNNQFGIPDIYKLDEALPARYRQSSKSAWMANRAIWNKVDQFETTNGSKLFEGVVGNPGRLLGVNTYEAEAMDGALATGDDYCLVFGDFDHYVIADRLSTVEFIPHLFGNSNRPTGQRGLYATFRMGADSVHDAAFKLLKV